MRVKYTFLFVLAISYISASAQDVTKKEIENKYVVASDYSKLKNYDAAIPALNWLLKNAPSYSKSVQSYAIRAFETKANQVDDNAYKKVLLDSMLFAFESKRTHHGLSDLDKNKLAFRYYKYFRKDASKHKAAFEVFQDVFSSPNSVINNNIVPYMFMANQYSKNVNTLNTDQVNKVYDQIEKVVILKKEEGPKVKLDKYMSTVDNLYVRLIGDGVSCETATRLAKGLNRADSVNVSKRLMSITLEAKCGRTEIYQNALELLARNEPNPGIFKVLAQYKASDKEYTKAIELYSKASTLEEDKTKKANIYFDIAQLHFIDMNKPEARKYALKSIKLDEDQSAKAYSLIGRMYANSFNECAQGDNPIEDRAVFFLAYDMFQKANDRAGMEEMMEQFPTKSEAFGYDLYAGNVIEVKCWINEKTKVMTKSSNQ